MGEMPVTLAATSVLSLLFLVLSLLVVRERVRSEVSLGDGSGSVGFGGESTASPLFVAVRVQGNFAEYVPLSLIGIGLLEGQGASTLLVTGLAVALVISRIMHPVGMHLSAPNPFRAGGITVQWLVLLGTGVAGLLHVLSS